MNLHEIPEERIPLLNDRNLYFNVEKKLKSSIKLVLLILTLERLAYFIGVGNLFLFLSHKGRGGTLNDAKCLKAVLFFCGISTLPSPIFSVFADECLGKYAVILLGLVLNLIAYLLIVIEQLHNAPSLLCFNDIEILNQNYTQCHYHHENENEYNCVFCIYFTFTLIGIGTACIRTNLSPFGAEQVKNLGTSAIRKFFNWYYWCVNFSSLIGIGLLAYIEQSFLTGWFWAYTICLLLHIFALIIFVFGKPIFIMQKLTGSSLLLLDFIGILKNAVINKKNFKNGPPVPFLLSELIMKPTYMDYAKICFGGKYKHNQVEDLKSFIKILLMFLILTPFWAAYYQMQTTFQAQGLHMKLYLNNDVNDGKFSFQIPTAWMIMFSNIMLLVSIPILNCTIFPFLEKKGFCCSFVNQIAIGIIMAILAMIVAGILESYRLNSWKTNNTTYNAVNISMLLQFPQYILIALAEAFSGVASLRYAYSIAPATLKSSILSFCLSSQGIGCFMSLGLIHIMQWTGWLPKLDSSINDGHLDFYFYILSTLLLLCFTLFMIVNYNYHNKYET